MMRIFMLLHGVNFNLMRNVVRFIVIGFVFLLLGCSDDVDLSLKSRNSYTNFQDKLSSCQVNFNNNTFQTVFAKCNIDFVNIEDCLDESTCYKKRESIFNDYDLIQKKQCQIYENLDRLCQKGYEQEQWFINHRLIKFDGPVAKQLFSFMGVYFNRLWWKSKPFLTQKSYIDIAVVANDGDKQSFYDGAQLAVDLYNDHGELKTRKLRLIRHSVERNAGYLVRLSNKIQNTKSVIAVIDTTQSLYSPLISEMYEKAGLLHLLTSTSQNNILRENMRLNFRLIATNQALAEESAKFCAKKSYRKLAILTDFDSDAALELSRAFYIHAEKLGVEVVYWNSFFKTTQDFTQIILDSAELSVDAIYIATEHPEPVVEIMKQAKLMGFSSLKFLGTESLEKQSFLTQYRKTTNGLIVPSVFNKSNKANENVSFISLYQKKYGFTPDLHAAVAYDAVNLIANSINVVTSTLSFDLASGLRYGNTWEGANQAYSFDEIGNLKKPFIVFKELQKGLFKELK